MHAAETHTGTGCSVKPADAELCLLVYGNEWRSLGKICVNMLRIML